MFGLRRAPWLLAGDARLFIAPLHHATITLSPEQKLKMNQHPDAI